MRFHQFSENSAMDDTVEIMKKSFSPERKAVQAEVLGLVRDVEMGKGDKMELAMKLTALTKRELEAKAADADLKYSVDNNIKLMKRAMDKLTGVTESVGKIAELTETEVVKIIRSKRGLGSLRNRSAYDGLSKIKNIELDKNAAPKKAVGEDMDPEGPEVTIGDYTTTHFYMCGSAIKTAEKHADKPGMEKLIQLQDMVYKLERAVMDTGEASEDVKNFARELHIEVMNTAAEIGVEDEVAQYQGMHLNSIIKGDPKPGFGRVDQVEESLTEAEFDAWDFFDDNIDSIEDLENYNWDSVSNEEIKDLLRYADFMYDANASAPSFTPDGANAEDPNGYDVEALGFWTDAENFLDNLLAQRQGNVSESLEALTEAEFDEAAGEKDACYRKVKSRYKVWPSAYASGALTKCRKVGAANWGNSKKK